MKYITAEHITLETILQPHMSTQVAEVQELYRAREHPPKHCSDLQTTADTSANRTTLRRKKSVATLTVTTCNKVDQIMQTQRSCTVFAIVSQKNGETEATGTKRICRLTGTFHILSMRSDVRVSLVGGCSQWFKLWNIDKVFFRSANQWESILKILCQELYWTDKLGSIQPVCKHGAIDVFEGCRLFPLFYCDKIMLPVLMYPLF